MPLLDGVNALLHSPIVRARLLISEIQTFETKMNLDEVIPLELAHPVDQVVPIEATHIGFVCANLAGEVSMVKPSHHFDGVSTTFPKIARQKNEPPSMTLARCLRERVGFAAERIYPLQGLGVTPHSKTFYFAGLRKEATPALPSPTHKTHWLTPEDALQKLWASDNQASKKRDMDVLENVPMQQLSPSRNVLLMIRELHKIGFQRLRALPGMSPSGLAWRCSILPVTFVSRMHGAKQEPDVSDWLDDLFRSPFWCYTYKSVSGQCPFEWHNVSFSNPKALAQKFIKDVPEIAFAGWGPDDAYAAWYEELLDATAPFGLFYSYADWDFPEAYLPTLMTGTDTRLRMPPPGTAPDRNFPLPQPTLFSPEPSVLQNIMYKTEAMTEWWILANCAGRFRGDDFSAETRFDMTEALRIFCATGRLPDDALQRLAMFYRLFRKFKWNETLPTTEWDAWAYRTLFLEVWNVNVPPVYRDNSYCRTWNTAYLPQIDDCLALILGIHHSTIYEKA